MTDQLQSLDCSCPCGESKFVVEGTLVLRFICHCKICQAVYKKPYADVTALPANYVALPADQKIKFHRYRSPPALRRGTCPSCENPVVGFLQLMPFFGLAFVPSVNFPTEVTLPEPSLHIFYDRRISDVVDDLPKFSGYWGCQWAVTQRFMTAMMRQRSVSG